MELWRPSATEAELSGFTTATASSGNDVTSDTLGQSAVSLSGAIDSKTHFFAAGEFSREDRASPMISPRCSGSFSWAIIADGSGTCAWIGRFNDRNNLFFRSDLDGFHDTNPNGIVGGNSLPSVDRVFYRRTYSEEVGETAVLTSALINNVRVQFQLASPITQFVPVIYGTRVRGADFGRRDVHQRHVAIGAADEPAVSG